MKPNVGHVEMASGITSLIKTVLSLTNRVFYPTLNFQRANPQLGLEDSPFEVVSRLTPWPEGTTPRTAGVSAFGLGGTNAHLVVQAPLSTPQARAQQMGPCVVVLGKKPQCPGTDAKRPAGETGRTSRDTLTGRGLHPASRAFLRPGT